MHLNDARLDLKDPVLDERLREWFAQAKEADASDVHLTAGAAPTMRVHGELKKLVDTVLSPQDCERMAYSLMTSGQRAQFEARGEVDFSYSVPGISRFRVNVYRQRGCPSVAARLVPTRVPSFASLGLPKHVERFTERPQGLLLVTGPTGSGKSTTLAALIDSINHRESKHIVTLEDPIEYLHRHDRCLIDQREVGQDTESFDRGLRAALRQDPDVILVGEMRDLETIATAIMAAETGHLVLATLHTPDAVQTIGRIIDVFPPGQQAQIRVQLAAVLIAVVSQRLLPEATGKGRVVACEILVNTPAVANLIRTEKVHQIKSVMQTGRQYGMQTMEMHVRELLQQGRIRDDAVRQWLPDWFGHLA
ncbi:MAG: type IV pilus twitching motility protein PilT [Alicyclobacillaceae bacterium]|nr:type IV pilus twitching motility protein PilT [Alicyclobacillaceae bacterium]